MKIPKKIFQTWHRKHNPDVERLTQNWKDLNPEYTHEFFDEEAMQLFMEENFDKDVVECYDRVENIQTKSDFWRYSVIYINGGVYVDVDTVPVKPLDDILDEDDDAVFVRTPVPHWGISHFTNNPIVIMAGAFIAATPRHPILLHMIEGICSSIRNNEFPEQIHELTGTERITNAIYDFCDVDYFELGYIPNARERVKILAHPVNGPGDNLYTHETITTIDGEIAIETQTAVHETQRKQHYGWYHERALPLYRMTSSTLSDIIRLESELLIRYTWNNKIKVGKYDTIAGGLQYDLLISGTTNGDITFEEEFLRQHPDVTKGYSVVGIKKNISTTMQDNLSIIEKNISIYNSENTSDLTEYVGECENVFLKLDVRGAEVDWLVEGTSDLSKFKQMVVRVCPFEIGKQNEDILDVSYWHKIFKCIRRVKDTHKLIHVCGEGGKIKVPAPDWYISKYGVKIIELPQIPTFTFMRLSNHVDVWNDQVRCLKPVTCYKDKPTTGDEAKEILTGWPWT